MSDNANDVVLDRTVDAPAELVWQMRTDPDHLAQWYWPKGAHIPIAEFDITFGGRRFIAMEMQTPDGAVRMYFTGEHRVIEPFTRLVYTEAMATETGDRIPADQLPPGHPELTEVRVELESQGDKTTMILTHAGVPADSPGAMGWTMALDKLEALLGKR